MPSGTINSNIANLAINISLNGAGITKGINQAQAAVSKMQQTMQNQGMQLAAVGAGLTAAWSSPLMSLAQKGISFNNSMEQANSNFGTLLGDFTKGKNLVEEIRKFAETTPFEMPGLARSAQSLLSFGVEANRIMPTVKMLGDVAMGNQQKFDSLTLAYAQIQSTGRLMGQDLLQLVNQGFNPLQIISEKTGKSMADLKKDMENGAISAEMVDIAFKIATSSGGRFYNSMGIASKTFDGQMSTLRDTVNSTLGSVVKPVFEMLSRTVIPLVTKKVTELANWFNQLSSRTQLIITGILGLSIAIGPLLAGMGAMVALAGFIAPAIAALVSPISLVIVALGAFAAYLIYLYNTNKDFATSVQTTWTNILNWIGGVIASLQTLWNTYGEAFIIGIKTAFNSLYALIKPVMWSMASSVSEAFNDMKASAEDLAKFFNEIGPEIKAVMSAVGLTAWWMMGIVVSAVGGILKGIGPFIKGIVDSFEAVVYGALAVSSAMTGKFGLALEYTKRSASEVGQVAVDAFNTFKDVGQGMYDASYAYGKGTAAAMDEITSGINRMNVAIGKSTSSSMGQMYADIYAARAQIFSHAVPYTDEPVLGGMDEDLAAMIAKLKGLAEGGKDGTKEADKMADAFRGVAGAIKSQADEFKNFVGLFDKVNRSGPSSGKTLLNRIKKQAEEMTKWQKDMAILEARLGPGNVDLTEELRGMGPGSSRQIKGLSSLSNEDLQQYVDYYGTKKRIGTEEATRTVNVEHSGVLEVRGIDNKGQLTAVMQIVTDGMNRDASKYLNSPVNSSRTISRVTKP